MKQKTQNRSKAKYDQKTIWKWVAIGFIIFSTWFLTILDIQWNWTGWPRYNLNLSDTQQDMYDSVSIETYVGSWNVFFYFTNISVIIVSIALTFGLLFPKYFRKQVKLIIITYSLITMIFFWSALAPFYVWDQSVYFSFITVYEHGILFIGFFIWCFISKENDKKVKGKYFWLFSYPVAFLAINIWLFFYSNKKVAVYPFLNMTNFFALYLHPALSVFLSVMSIIVIAASIWYIFWLMDNWGFWKEKKKSNTKKYKK